MRRSQPGSSGAREALRAVQHPGREGMSGSTGFLHDGDGFSTSRNAIPQPWKEGPGAVLGGYPH